MDYQKVNRLENELENVFGFSPVDPREISYNELAETLVKMSEIYQGKLVTTTDLEPVIGFVRVIEELGLVDPNTRNFLCSIKVLDSEKNRVLGSKNEWLDTNCYVFSNDLEYVMIQMTDMDFVNEHFGSLLNKHLFKPFKVKPIE